jgi:hypothetical protein
MESSTANQEQLLSLAQCCLLLHESSSTKRVDIGVLVATSSAFLLFDMSWEGYGLLVLPERSGGSTDVSLHAASVMTQFATAVLVVYACLSLPRRPDVFYKGEIVDGQYTVSILRRQVL